MMDSFKKRFLVGVNLHKAEKIWDMGIQALAEFWAPWMELSFSVCEIERGWTWRGYLPMANIWACPHMVLFFGSSRLGGNMEFNWCYWASGLGWASHSKGLFKNHLATKHWSYVARLASETMGDKILLVKTEIASPAKARSIEGMGTSWHH